MDWKYAGAALVLIGAVGCTTTSGGDEPSSTSTTTTSAGAGGGTSSSSATTSSSSGAGGGEGGSGGFSPPAMRGRMAVGHYLGDFEVEAFGSDDFTTVGELEPGGPTSGLLGISKHDVLVVAREGGESFNAYDGETLLPLTGSPYTTAFGPVDFAHDDQRDLLYVYCIGRPGDTDKSSLTVYDTSSIPWSEVAGSPFTIDVPGIGIEVDPITGTVFGVSLTTFWAVTVEGGEVVHMDGSPETFASGFGSSIAIDPMRRRVYVGEARVGGTQRVHVLDTDTFSPHQRSPVVVPGSIQGEIEVNLADGEVWVVDYNSSTLHSIQASPLEARDSCGTMGCPIPPTETGLAIDHELGRLFITHLPSLANPDDGNGSLSVWDISTGGEPVEITGSGTRPTLSVYPFTATAF